MKEGILSPERAVSLGIFVVIFIILIVILLKVADKV